MPYPKQYEDPYTTTVTMERDMFALAKKAKILLSRCLAVGMMVMFETEMEADNTAWTADMVAEYRKIKDRDLQKIEEFIRVEKKKDKAVAAIHDKVKAVEAADNELIEVYDEIDERRKLVKPSEFRPDYMKRLVKPLAGEAVEDHG